MKPFERSKPQHFSRSLLCGLVVLLSSLSVRATENAPRKPFAQWADLPAPREFTVRLWYQEAEAYHIWAGNNRHDITVHRDGEDYGVDYTEGIVALEYGFTPHWAADLNLAYGTVGTRSFNPTGGSQSTTGLLDTSFGVRYQICREGEVKPGWLPTVTFRAGAVLPGSYNKHFPFAPGNRSAAIEPALFVKKHLGWPGFGLYADVFYRWMRTSGDDQYGAAIGLFQEIRSWTLDAGYRHFQQISGQDLVFHGTGAPLAYSPQVREVRDSFEAGFSYRTPKRQWEYGFYSSKTFAGSNTGSAFWLGGYIEVPFGGSAGH